MLAIGSAWRAFKIALPIALILGLGFALWLTKRSEARAIEALGAQKVAHAVTIASLNSVTTALEKQTSMVRIWTAEADRRKEAARIALGAAVAKEKRAGQVMVRIELGRVRRAPVAACATSEAVLAARDVL